jgi:chemotaxis protein histidine kinase CheA
MNNSEDSSEQNESNESDEEGETDESNPNEEEKNGKPSGESKSGKPSKSKQKIEDMEEQEQPEDAVGSEQKQDDKENSPSQEKNDEMNNSEDNMDEQKQPEDPEDVVGSEQKQEKQKQDNEGEATTDSDEAQTEDESESKETQKPSNKEQESKPKHSANTPPSSDPVKRKKEPFEKTAFNAPDIKQAENKDIFNDDMTEAKVDGSFDMGDMFQDKVKAAGALTRNDVLPPMGFRPQGKGEYTLNSQSLSTVRIIRDKAKKLMEETLLEEELLVSRGSRIAKDKLYKVMLNSNDIFLKRFETSQTSADVYVMMDISGSMQGVINQAKEAFATTLVAFEDIEGVRIGGGVFPHYNNVFTPLFDIGEKKKIKNSLNRLNEIDANGAEDIAEAVKCGIAKVLEKTSIDRKKILIVITDGGQSEDPQALLQLERAKKLGFKVIGIGVGKAANNVKNVFEYADVIHNMKDMPGIVSKLFESVMKDYLQHKKPAVKESIKNAA